MRGVGVKGGTSGCFLQASNSEAQSAAVHRIVSNFFIVVDLFVNLEDGEGEKGCRSHEADQEEDVSAELTH